MDNSRHRLVEDLFQQAADLPPDRRPAFLDNIGTRDPELREEVKSLICFLDNGRIPSLIALGKEEEPGLVPGLVGKLIGPYTILGVLGEGGFGTVYLAEQDDPIHRQVALKIIKLGMDTKQVVARFNLERQALARMDHSNIARVFEAGSTESGRPYFVMELVNGDCISDFCDKHHLSIRKRLGLFLQVCKAVQHAHQKGIIHRDLKPSNVLVILQEGIPMPKIIDFGIAKAMDRPSTDKTHYTQYQKYVGTPEYMSPEQAETGGTDIDTRTDIYSLGVLAYVLLTGSTPFDRKTLQSASYEEIQRIVKEEIPPSPSQALQRLGSDLEVVARSRLTTPQILRRTIRGELDWIVMKALEKDRQRRYITASSLAEDVERYLNNEPVLAGPPGLFYRFRKFIRRHRMGVVTAGLIGLAIITGLGIAAVGFLQAEQARAALQVERDAVKVNAEKANTEVIKARAVTKFLKQALESVNPWNLRKHDASMRVFLDKAAEHIETGVLSGQPDVEASVRMILGRLYSLLGLYGDAEVNFCVAETLREHVLGENAPETLFTRNALAVLYRRQGRTDKAEKLLQVIQETSRQVLGEEHPQTLITMNSRAVCLQRMGRFAESEALQRQTLNIRRNMLGEDHLDTIRSRINLGSVLLEQQKAKEAESLLRKAIASGQRVFGAEHPVTVKAIGILAGALRMCKKFGEAESLFQRSLNVHRRVLGEHHPETTKMKIGYFWQLVDMKKIDRYRNMIPEMLSTYKQYSKQPYTDEVELYNYAYLLLWCLQKHMLTTERKVQKTDGTDRSLMAKLAESLLNKALKRYYRTLGEEHPRTLANMNLLANVYFIQRRLAEAEKLYRKIFWHQRRTLGEEHPDTLKSLANLGITFLFRGKRSQAETVLRKVQATQCRILGDDHPDLVKVKLYLSLVLRRQGRLACAKSILRGALEIQKRTLGANHPETLMIDYNLTELTRILDKTKRISVPGGRIDKLIR